MKLIISILILLLTLSCKQNQEKEIFIENQIEKAKKVTLKNFSY